MNNSKTEPKNEIPEINLPKLETGSGRLADVIIEDDIASANQSQKSKEILGDLTATYPNYLRVWADDGLVKRLEAIEGVMQVAQNSTWRTMYSVAVDPRYRVSWVMEEIRAVAKTGL